MEIEDFATLIFLMKEEHFPYSISRLRNYKRSKTFGRLKDGKLRVFLALGAENPFAFTSNGSKVGLFQGTRAFCRAVLAESWRGDKVEKDAHPE
jgi:hypothetical protein